MGGWVGLEALGILTRMGRDIGSVVLPEYMNGLQNFSPTRQSAKSEMRSVLVDFSGVNNRLKESQRRPPSRASKGNAQPLRRMGMQGAKPLLSKCLNYRNRTLCELTSEAHISARIMCALILFTIALARYI